VNVHSGNSINLIKDQHVLATKTLFLCLVLRFWDPWLIKVSLRICNGHSDEYKLVTDMMKIGLERFQNFIIVNSEVFLLGTLDKL
jgi:hypothetical protein